MADGSKPLLLSREDVAKVLRGAFVAAAGAALTYIATKVIPDLQNEPGANALLFTALSTGVNLLRKWLTDTRDEA